MPVGVRESRRADPRTRSLPSPGAAALMLLLPVTMFHLLLVARSGPARLLGPPPYLPGLEELWSPWALLLCLTWLGLQAALYLLPARKVWPLLANARGRRRRAGARREGRTPSTLIRTALCPQVAEGQELKDKSRLRYPINGAWGARSLSGAAGLGGGAPGPMGRSWRCARDPKLLFCSSFTPRTDIGGFIGSLHTPPSFIPSTQRSGWGDPPRAKVSDYWLGLQPPWALGCVCVCV